MTTETWMDRTVRIVREHGPMTREKFNQLTGLPLKRSSTLLGKAAMYGRVVRLMKYRPSHIPQLRTSAVYIAKPPNDNERTKWK